MAFNFGNLKVNVDKQKPTKTSGFNFGGLQDRANLVSQQRKEEQFRVAEENAKKAQIEAEKAQEKVAFWEGIKNIPKEVIKGAIVRPALSLAEIPKNIYGRVTGKEQTFGEVNVPFVGPVESYQRESGRIAGEIVEGKKPLRSILAPIGESILDVSSLGVGGKLAKGAIKQTGKQILKQGVREGALYGAGYGSTQALKEGQGVEDSAKTIGTSTLVGAVLPPAIIGAGRLAGKIARTLKPGELAPIVKEIEETTAKKLTPSEALQVKADLEKGISKEAIINDIIEPPTRTTSPVEAPKPKVEVKTPVKEITPLQEGGLIKEARKYKSADEFVRNVYNDEMPLELPSDVSRAVQKLPNRKLIPQEIRKDVEKIWNGLVKNENVDISTLKAGEYGQNTQNLPNVLENISKKKRNIDSPIIVNQDGLILDGHHRVAQAIRNGQTNIKAQVVPFKGEFEQALKDFHKQSLSQPQGITPRVEVTIAENAKISKIAKSIEQKMKDAGMVDEDIEKATFEGITVKGQAEEMAKILQDKNLVDDIISGKKPLTEKVRPSSFIKAVEDEALKTGDAKTLEKLAKSKIAGETSLSAQDLRMAAERDPDSAVIKMREIIKVREEALQKRLKKDVKISQAKKVAEKEVEKASKSKKSTKATWSSFISEIKC